MKKIIATLLCVGTFALQANTVRLANNELTETITISLEKDSARDMALVATIKYDCLDENACENDPYEISTIIEEINKTVLVANKKNTKKKLITIIGGTALGIAAWNIIIKQSDKKIPVSKEIKKQLRIVNGIGSVTAGGAGLNIAMATTSFESRAKSMKKVINYLALLNSGNDDNYFFRIEDFDYIKDVLSTVPEKY